jgi:hypothetical protein
MTELEVHFAIRVSARSFAGIQQDETATGLSMRASETLKEWHDFYVL